MAATHGRDATLTLEAEVALEAYRTAIRQGYPAEWAMEDAIRALDRVRAASPDDERVERMATALHGWYHAGDPSAVKLADEPESRREVWRADARKVLAAAGNG